MQQNDFDQVFAALNRGGVRYIVVGGVAVVLHGHLRFTADLDLVVALDPANIAASLAALATLGYRPRAPVASEQFADPDVRREWIVEKGTVVFSFWSPAHPATSVDLFVEEPFDFEAAFARALHVDLDGTQVVVASIPDLVELKKRAGRPGDLEDIRALEALSREATHGPGRTP
jgi:hypothetical protein